MLNEKRFVDLEFDVGAAEAVFIGAVGNIVPGSKVFSLNPGEPGRSEAAGRCTARLDLLGCFKNFRPGLWWVVFVKASFFESVLVVIKDRRRRIVWEGQHCAVWLRIIGNDTRQVLRLVELEAALFEHFSCWNHRAFGGHHDAATGIENLNDCWWLL